MLARSSCAAFPAFAALAHLLLPALCLCLLLIDRTVQGEGVRGPVPRVLHAQLQARAEEGPRRQGRYLLFTYSLCSRFVRLLILPVFVAWSSLACSRLCLAVRFSFGCTLLAHWLKVNNRPNCRAARPSGFARMLIGLQSLCGLFTFPLLFLCFLADSVSARFAAS